MKTQKIIDRCAQKFRHTKTLSLRIVIIYNQTKNHSNSYTKKIF